MTTTRKPKSKTLRATVEWDGDGYWVATITPNVFTQAKQISQLRERLVEVVKLMTGSVVTADDIALDIAFPGAEEAEAVRIERAELTDRERLMATRLARVVHDLHDRGVSFRDIASLTGISFQRAQQIADQPLVDA